MTASGGRGWLVGGGIEEKRLMDNSVVIVGGGHVW